MSRNPNRRMGCEVIELRILFLGDLSSAPFPDLIIKILGLKRQSIENLKHH